MTGAIYPFPCLVKRKGDRVDCVQLHLISKQFAMFWTSNPEVLGNHVFPNASQVSNTSLIIFQVGPTSFMELLLE